MNQDLLNGLIMMFAMLTLCSKVHDMRANRLLGYSIPLIRNSMYVTAVITFGLAVTQLVMLCE